MSNLREGARISGLTLAGGIAALVVLLILASMAIFGWGFLAQATADFRGETSKKEQVEASGQYRIAAYDSFFNLCASVQAQEDAIANQLAERETAAPTRQAQIDANVTASRNVRASLIRQYNADAAKSYTAGQFRDSNLPYQLDTNTEETSCAA